MTKHCPACHEPLVTTETEAGEQVCLACGVVLSSTAYITSYSTTNHVTHPSLSLCRSKHQWRKELDHICHSLNVEEVKERAWYFLQQCLDGGLGVRPRRLVVAVCALLAARESGQSKSLVELSEHLGVDLSMLKRVYKKTEQFLKQYTNIPYPTASDPSHFLSSKAARLRELSSNYALPNITPFIEQSARIMLMYAARAGLITGRRPDTLAVAALLFALEAELGRDLDVVRKGLEGELAHQLDVSAKSVARIRSEQRRVFSTYLRTQPELVHAEHLFSKHSRTSMRRDFFAACLKTLILRWSDIVAPAAQTTEKTTTTHTHPVAAATLPNLVQQPTTTTTSFAALPANEPPKLDELHMMDFPAPAFQRCQQKPTTSSIPPTTRTQDELNAPQLTERDLSPLEEQAYLRTPDEIQLYLQHSQIS